MDDEIALTWSIFATPTNARATVAGLGGNAASFRSDEAGRFVVRATAASDDPALDQWCDVNVDVVVERPVARCPRAPLQTDVGVSLPLVGEGLISSGTVSSEWSLVSAPSDSMVSLATTGVAGTATFSSTIPGDYVLTLRVVDAAGHIDSCSVDVSVTEPTSHPAARCPGMILTSPLQEAVVVGSFSAIPPAELAWGLVQRPVGSDAFVEQVEGQDGVAALVPDLAGRYEVEFVVSDAEGRRASCRTEVLAVSTEGLRVEMFWTDPQTDIDLHLLHPEAFVWFHPALSCYWSNCKDGVAWNSPGSADDPFLDIDDRHGFGPENINVTSPQPQTYRVAVHAYGGPRDWPTTSAVVRIYCGAGSLEPVFESEPMALEAEDAFWRVADVRIHDGTCDVDVLGTVTDKLDAQRQR